MGQQNFLVHGLGVPSFWENCPKSAINFRNAATCIWPAYSHYEDTFFCGTQKSRYKRISTTDKLIEGVFQIIQYNKSKRIFSLESSAIQWFFKKATFPTYNLNVTHLWYGPADCSKTIEHAASWLILRSLFQFIFYSIVTMISVGCVAIISLSLAHRGDLALAINNVLWCLVPALFLATYYR